MANARLADDPVTRLFALPGEEFVSARDALAKARKASGDKDGALAVKGLRRPTVAASAVNWLAREATKDLEALVRLGDRLRDAHQSLADGGDGADIRKVTADRRRRTAALVDRAVAHLGPAGEAQRSAVTDTLDAAVSDADAGALVLSGRLSKELDAPSGFGAELAFVSTRPPEPQRRPPRDERRAARRARREPLAEPASAPAPAPVETPPVAQPAPVDKKLVALRAALQREADAAAQAAQSAAREATVARAEVARRQHELVEAEAVLHAAEERARLTQWKSVAAQNDLRHAGE